MSQLAKPVKVFGEFGDGPGQLDRPYDLAVDAQGRVFVAEIGNDRVSVFSRDGEFERHVDGFDEVRGLCVDNAFGRLLTVAHVLCQLQATDVQSGVVVGKLGSEGSGENQFRNPQGVCTDEFGNVVVIDTWNHRVCVLSPDLRWSFAFGKNGEEEDQFTYPMHACFAGDTLLVSNTCHYRVQAMRIQRKHASGEITRLSFAATFGRYGDGPGQFRGPMGVCVDAATGRVFISDEGNARVCVFDSQYRYLHSVAVSGSSCACMYTQPNEPIGVFVVNPSAHEVHMYAIP